MFHRETENVQRRIMVTIMNRTTLTTLPASYSKLSYAFRPRQASAGRADLGRVPFIAFNILTTAQSRFVGEHLPERRPTCVQNRFGQSGFSKFAGIDITYNNGAIGSRKARGRGMKKMFSSVRNLGMDSFDSLSVTGTLGIRKLFFVFAEKAWIADGAAVRKNSKRFEAEINPYWRKIVAIMAFNCARYIYIPSTSCVLRKAAAFNVTCDAAARPETENALPINSYPVGDAYRSRNEWEPSERLFTSIARALLYFIPRFREAPADSRNGIAVKSKLRCGTSSVLDKINPSRPLRSPFHGMLLRVHAVIPDKITCTCVLTQLVGAVAFNAKSISDMFNVSQGVVTYVMVRGRAKLQLLFYPDLIAVFVERGNT